MDTINSIGNAKQILREVSRVIVGKDEVMIKVLLGIVAGGHILMEDIPGVGKTTMALAFSKALGLEYNRVQFTPDVLPSDVTGYSIYDKNTGTMRYQRGAVLCNLFLADELNRATSRTQSALLQAMEEGAVTVDNTTYPVPQPFIVIATQNPTGAKGTQMLPDSPGLRSPLFRSHRFRYWPYTLLCRPSPLLLRSLSNIPYTSPESRQERPA